MNTDEKSRYFQELSRNLRHEGLTVKPETEEGLLPVELDGQRLCQITETSGVRYWKEDVASDSRQEALDRVTAITKSTAEYMNQMETASQLTASGLTGDYRLLADFNNVVLAGHPTRYGVQFVTWERVRERTALHQGHYYGPDIGVDGYASAKRNFAARSGLIPRDSLFTPEQLTAIYLSIHETLESDDPITEERRKLLKSTMEQIERGVPDLEARMARSEQEELAAMEAPQDCGMRFN